jgi:hypothetical protein
LMVLRPTRLVWEKEVEVEMRALYKWSTLGMAVVCTNSEVQKLLSDFSLINCDLLACGAPKAAECLCTGPEAFTVVDNSAHRS